MSDATELRLTYVDHDAKATSRTPDNPDVPFDGAAYMKGLGRRGRIREYGWSLTSGNTKIKLLRPRGSLMLMTGGHGAIIDLTPWQMLRVARWLAWGALRRSLTRT